MILTPYADIATTVNELNNLVNVEDKLTIFVKELYSWVTYDVNSTAVIDNYSVFAAYNNIGRWILTNTLNNNIKIHNSNITLSALRSVSLNNNLLEYTNPLIFNVYGITLTSGTNVKVLIAGIYSDTSWNFSLDTPIFVKSNGILTQNLSYSRNYLIQIAIPINSNTIEINKEIIYDNQ